MKPELKKRSARILIVTALWLVIWELAARITGNDIILVGPAETLGLFL